MAALRARVVTQAARVTPLAPADRRVARGVLGLYLLFLLYASLFPFHFTLDGDTIRSNLAAAVVFPRDASRETFSLTDLASNGILGGPFGLLLVLGGLAGEARGTRLFRVGIASVGVAAAVEGLQLLIPERTASTIDVGGQVAGALAGALAAHLFVGAAGRQLAAHGLVALRRDPALGPSAIVMAILAADALHPYTATLDVRTVWKSFKRATWLPLQAADQPSWHAALVSDVLPAAVLAALLLAVFRRSSARARLGAWGFVTGYGMALQLARLFVERLSPNADHALAVSVGALVGVVAGPMVTGLPFARAHAAPAVALAAAALLAYAELEPFDFRLTAAMATSKAAHVEWLPFASYYAAAVQDALFDAGKKLVLGGLLGTALRACRLPHPAGWVLAYATLLEALQLLQASHQPSVTDVVSLTAGAAMGAAILDRYRALIADAGPGGGRIIGASRPGVLTSGREGRAGDVVD